MAVYGIHYTLRKTGQDYSGLYDAIKAYGFYNSCTTSTWFVKTYETPMQILSKLSPHLDSNDSILVIEVTSNYQGYLSQADWDWFKEAFS